MKFFRSINILVLFTMLATTPVLAGCSSKQDPANQQVKAINAIRTELELPDLPLKFVEMTAMTNSPSGNLEVAHYQDKDGRNYYVNPGTNQVVEIDARSLLPALSAGTATLSEEVITAKARKFISAAVPDFDNQQAKWTYEEGSKIDNYFFSWYAEMKPGSMNRPFAQIALHKSGLLFAYYNTLFLDK